MTRKLSEMNPAVNAIRYVENAYNVADLARRGTFAIYDDFNPSGVDYAGPIISTADLSYEIWKNGGRID